MVCSICSGVKIGRRLASETFGLSEGNISVVVPASRVSVPSSDELIQRAAGSPSRLRTHVVSATVRPASRATVTTRSTSASFDAAVER